ncbi:MAG: cobalamin transport system permease protein [Bryobacterales bacterium]|jgi:iron complex transport system permease protein|nr:cobalamin transport system permease protein [Bryobacterales bacterium]
MENKSARWAFALIFSVSAMIISGLIAVLAGSHHLNLTRALHGVSPDHEILMELRLPRALLALWTGGALSLSGVLFQALLRNPLATPDTLGVSSGASLGAVLAIFFGWGARGGISGVSVAACVGAAAVLVLVVSVSSDRGKVSSIGLLLAGITINVICGAAIVFLANLVGFLKSFAVTRWLMGGLDPPEYSTLLWLTILLTPVVLLVLWHGREWNVLAVGDTWAATRGLSTTRLLLLGCIAGSILTGAVTALTGPIGFVGLIIPHALRMWLGADHRILAPCSFLLGAAFVAICDVFARTILAPVEIPVGVITALLGGPFFIWMLRSRRAGIRI